MLPLEGYEDTLHCLFVLVHSPRKPSTWWNMQYDSSISTCVHDTGPALLLFLCILASFLVFSLQEVLARPPITDIDVKLVYYHTN